ncbi:remorin [Tanacetum coccineum]
MRPVEDKGCLNHVSTLENRHRTALGKPTPSKWDDAQKWLVKLSRGGDKSHSSNEPRNSNADDMRLIAQVPKREYSSSEDGETSDGIIVHYEGIETKNVDYDDTMVRSICVRDMGTEMTPIASQEPSRTATPVRATTPAARSPIGSGSSTPVRSLTNGGHNVEVGGTTRFARQRVEVTGENTGENKMVDQHHKANPLETRAMAWDEAERAKYMASDRFIVFAKTDSDYDLLNIIRYKREEVKIQAWENHEKRKAEMEMKRLEKDLKSRSTEKYTINLLQLEGLQKRSEQKRR